MHILNKYVYIYVTSSWEAHAFLLYYRKSKPVNFATTLSMVGKCAVVNYHWTGWGHGMELEIPWVCHCRKKENKGRNLHSPKTFIKCLFTKTSEGPNPVIHNWFCRVELGITSTIVSSILNNWLKAFGQEANVFWSFKCVQWCFCWLKVSLPL